MIVAAYALLAISTSVCAAERSEMPLGALLCKEVEPTLEHSRIVRQPTTEGLRAFVESRVEQGRCMVVKEEIQVDVIDVDARGLALVELPNSGRWWTDAENIWGYFEAPAKVKAWKKS